MKTKTIQSRYETPEAVSHDLHTISEDARVLLDVTAEVATAKVAAARERLAAALETGKQTYAHLQESAFEGAKVADKVIRANPYQTIAAAFGLGALAGYLLSRRSRG